MDMSGLHCFAKRDDRVVAWQPGQVLKSRTDATDRPPNRTNLPEARRVYRYRYAARSRPMTPFDWQRILFDKFPPLFLGEVLLRVLFAYVAVFIFLKMSGRRGVRQISLFETLVILTLGSAAGDVVLYEDVPL